MRLEGWQSQGLEGDLDFPWSCGDSALQAPGLHSHLPLPFSLALPGHGGGPGSPRLSEAKHSCAAVDSDFFLNTVSGGLLWPAASVTTAPACSLLAGTQCPVGWQKV